MIVTYYSSNAITDVAPEYEGQAALDVDIDSGKANLKLSSITLAENKVFECRVPIPLDGKGQVADTAKLVVLGNLSLSCDSGHFLIFFHWSSHSNDPTGCGEERSFFFFLQMSNLLVFL